MNNKVIFCILVLIAGALSLSCITAHPGHGDYHPEEVVSPSESSSSPAPVQSSSNEASSSSASESSSASVSSGSSSGSSASSNSYSSQASSSGGSNYYEGSGESYDSSNPQASDDGSAPNEVVLKKDNKKNATDNNTNESNLNSSAVKEGDSLFSITNIIILILAFIIGFAAIVILHKFKVI